jgi:hypothetical protein
MNSAIGKVKYASKKPAIAIRIEAIKNRIKACFSLSKLSLKDRDKLFQIEPFSRFNSVLRNFTTKLNNTKPEAHAIMHEENSKMP